MNEGLGAEARTQWARVVVGSFVVMAATFVSILLITLELIPPVLIFGVIFAVLAYVVWRWHARRWVLPLAAVLALLAVIGNLQFIVEDLAHPDTIAGFGPTVVMLLAALLGAGAATAALAGVDPALRRPSAGAFVALAVVLVGVSAVATLGVEDDAQQAGDIVIVAEDVEYPERVTASAGAIALFLDNDDVIRHTFVIDEADVQQELPGAT